MKNAIHNGLLITAAVATIVAGANPVLAQGFNERRDVPAAATPTQKAPEGKIDRKSVRPQKAESLKPAPAPHVQGSEKTKPVTTEKTRPVTTGQAPDKARPAPTAQSPDQATTSTPQNAQARSKGAAPNAAAVRGSKFNTSVLVSSEQHAKIMEMLHGEINERLAEQVESFGLPIAELLTLTNVSFSISVGQVIPETVSIYSLPEQIVEYVPQYRGYAYVLVGDDILIVDPETLRIVAVIPA
jgi:hypothetical protein